MIFFLNIWFRIRERLGRRDPSYMSADWCEKNLHRFR